PDYKPDLVSGAFPASYFLAGGVAAAVGFGAAGANGGMSPQPASVICLNFHLPSTSVSADIEDHFPLSLPIAMLFVSIEMASVSDRKVAACLLDIFMSLGMFCMKGANIAIHCSRLTLVLFAAPLASSVIMRTGNSQRSAAPLTSLLHRLLEGLVEIVDALLVLLRHG